MVDRSVTVRLRVDVSDYLRGLQAAETATGSLIKRLDLTEASARKSEASIDRFSGRLALLTKSAFAFGPVLSPITTSAVPAIASLATQFGFAATAAGTAVLAFQGVGDALEAVNDAQLEPTAANLEAARRAMEELSPAARELVAQMRDMGPVFMGLRDAGAEGLLPGISESLDQLEVLQPRLERLLTTVGDATGDLLADSAESLASPRWGDFFDFIQSEARPVLATLGSTVGHLTHGLAELWEAMDPLSDDFSGGLLGIAQDFDSWAESLASTEGFREFVDYVRETGPQVVDMLGSLAMALVDLGTAAAPLGGPVLATLEAVADAVSALADSPLGSPILTAVSAMSALSLATKGWAAVSATSWVKGIRGADDYRAALGQMRGVLPVVGGGIAALALHAQEAATGFDASNAALGVMAGSMAGPWGIAVGGSIGLVADLADRFSDLDDTISSANEALASSDSSSLRGSLMALEDQRSGLGQLTGVGDALADTWDILTGGLGELDDKTGQVRQRLDELTISQGRSIDASDSHSDQADALARVMADLDGGFLTTAESAGELATALDSLFSPKLNLAEATDAQADALRNLNDELAENNRSLEGNTDGASKNRDAMRGLVKGALDLLNAQAEAGGTAEQLSRTLRRQRDAILDAGAAAGLSREEMRRYLRTLGLTPEVVDTLIQAHTDQALGNVRELQRAIDGIRGKTITIYANYLRSDIPDNTNTDPMGVGVLSEADGGTIPGRRLPYRDKVLAYLAPGEEVISNRYGQAEAFRSDRAAGRIPAYADGGSVYEQRYSNAWRPMTTASSAPPAAVSLGPLTVRGTLKTPWGPAEVEGIALQVANGVYDANRRFDEVNA